MINVIIPIITIWIHGTRPTECVPPFLKTAICAIENVLFIDQKNTGLVHISKIVDREYISELANSYCKNRECQSKDFYFYAWSGKLDPKARKEAATQLYKELNELVQEYKNRCGVTPLIEIVTHSHGGNVALLMAEQYQKDETSFCVDRLILLGCPVQKRTKTLISCPMFKKIYNIHSHNDWIQVLDPQGIHLISSIEEKDLFDIMNNFFSARHFDLVSDNLTEVHVRWDVRSDQSDVRRILFPLWLQKRLEYAGKYPMKRGLFHIEFTLDPFARQLPGVIDQIEKQEMIGGQAEIEIILR